MIPPLPHGLIVSLVWRRSATIQLVDTESAFLDNPLLVIIQYPPLPGDLAWLSLCCDGSLRGGRGLQVYKHPGGGSFDPGATDITVLGSVITPDLHLHRDKTEEAGRVQEE